MLRFILGLYYRTLLQFGILKANYRILESIGGQIDVMMRQIFILGIVYGILLGGAGFAQAEEPVVFSGDDQQFHAPPGPPPVVEPEFGPSAEEEDVFTPFGAAVQYSIGDPTDEEQLMLEFINWARADAANAAQVYAAALAGPNSQEVDADVQGAYTFFGVDTDEMISQFTTQPQSAQPLSFNPKLIEAARLHSQDQFNNVFQGHVSSSNPVSPNQPGDDLRARVTHQNYTTQSGLGENVFASADSVWEGHVAFDVDWGSGPFGMQSPPGHRNSNHNTLYREIGIGIVLGTNTNGSNDVGPLVVTQDFGYVVGDTPYITGVVYYDLNGNSFYDIGEGLPGVMVEITGINDFYAITSTSGGYSLPVSGNSTYEVTFSTSGLSDHVVMSTVSGGLNEKLDYTPTYDPPSITPPANIFVGFDNTFDFSGLGGATGYNLRQGDIITGAWTEGAENGTQQLTIVSTSGYNVIQSTTKFSGSFGFQLSQVNFEDQMVTLERLIRPTASSELQFRSRLNGATSSQTARVQVSTDNGSTWQDVYTQSGAPSVHTFESSFSLRTADLSGFADQNIKIRFFYDFNGGSAFTQTDFGWFFDNITVTNSSQVENLVEMDLGDVTEFTFNPDAEGEYVLEILASSGDRVFPFGPAVVVQAETGTPFVLPELTILSIEAISASQFEIHFKATGGANFDVSLEQADSPGGTYSDTGLSATSLGNDEYKFTVTFPMGDVKFYRVTASEFLL